MRGDRAIKDTVRRIDLLGPVHMDPERKDGFLARRDEATGFLRVDARLTRTGVFRYADREGNQWGELRTEDQVFDAATLSSFELTTVTDDHPSDFVSASNVRDVQVGTVGTDVRRDGRYMRASIVITDKAVIRSIEDGKIELSCGYTADVIQEQGTTDDGVSFAARQTNIRGNHVALVSDGRAGPSCALLVGRGDAFSNLTEIALMKTKKITIDGVEHTVPVEVADALEAKSKVVDEAKKWVEAKKKADAKAEADAEAEAAKKKAEAEKGAAPTDDAAALRARLDAIEADRAGEPARFDARVNLVANAREVLGVGVDAVTDGVADAALMRQVVLAVRPTLEAKLDAHAKMPGYLFASYQDAVERHRQGAKNVNDTSRAVFDALTVTDEERKLEDAEFDDAISNFYTGVPQVAAGVEG